MVYATVLNYCIKKNVMICKYYVFYRFKYFILK